MPTQAEQHTVARWTAGLVSTKARLRVTQLRVTGRNRFLRVVVGVVSLLASLFILPSSAALADTDCSTAAIPVVCENGLPGTPQSVWDIEGIGDPSIQGFSTDISVNVGSTVSFKIKTDAAAYSIKIYRLGWYGGNGAREVAVISPSASLPQTQPACVTSPVTEIYDCGTWAVSASWSVPSTAISGVYLARLIRSDTGGDSHIPFVVRNDASHSAMFMQTSDTTWQAYNPYGGSNFYVGAANGRGYKLSYNRPFTTRGDNKGRDFLFSNEYPMIRFLEQNGYDVTYTTGVDSDRRGQLIQNHQVFLSVGHDEYWSGTQRANVTAARDAGVNLAFFSGNEMYWKTRWEESQDGAHTADRTLVSYKETWANAKIDPSSAWTGTWRDPRFSPPADGGVPENALTGTAYVANFNDLAIQVPQQQGQLRLWRNSSVATLGAGQTATLAPHTVGYESNEDLDNGFRPGGLIHLSTTVGPTPEYLTDFGNTLVQKDTTHSLTLYRAASGALVFSAGTIQWAWGLDPQHDGGADPADPAMQQATVNLFADMGVQPGTLMTSLDAAAASTDTQAPTTVITSPAVGTSVASGSSVTVQGTAADTGGGLVAGVEVSTDAGATWHAATGTTSWSYTVIANGSQAIEVRARAMDDSANIGVAATRQITLTGALSIFGNVTPPTVAVADPGDVELGVRFTPKANGYVSGVRFYKGAGNTGTHTGTLWSSAGAQLATGVFTGETAGGWQTLTFGSPVAVTANTSYVVSYRAPNGHYSLNSWAFSYRDVGVDPLVANRSTATARNGLFLYGGGFPTQSNNDANYYVDVVYTPGANLPPAVVSTTPATGATDVALGVAPTATFSVAINVSTLDFTLETSTGTTVPGSATYDAATRTATFTPTSALSVGQTYTARVIASDTNGMAMAEPKVWTFTTVVDPSVARLFSDSSVPANPAVDDWSSVELGVKFTASVNGTITGVRYYQGAGNTGTHIGNLWSSTGSLLARATFPSSGTTGWQTVQFASPVAVTAGTTYVASYFAPNGHYSYNGGFFASAWTNGPLTAPAGANGVYLYSGSTAFPTDTYNSANYWVDPIFVPGGTPPPAVTAKTPADGATDIALNVHPTATFSTEMNAGTIQFTLSTNGTAIGGSVSYDAPSRTATFTPSANLTPGAAYTASIQGTGSNGTAMASPQTWTFTAQTAPGISYLFSSAAVPANLAADDYGPVELGVKFTPAVDGTVAGVRYYQGPGNTGTHVGSLWSATGLLLARATFAPSSTVGWQSVVFDAPVGVTAGTTYVVSYFAPDGHYSFDGAFFTTTWTNGQLSAPAGSNGVYAYNSAPAFPTSSYNSANYWVDPLFQAGGTAPTPSTFSVFLPAETPANPNWNDPSSVELGMKFTVDVPGKVTAIKFYKGSQNTGTHVGSLWTASGTLLGQVTFTNETASGWQTATLATPVDVVPGTTYVVSYHAPNGLYAMDLGGLVPPYNRPPLHVPANGGAYAYGSGGFPDQTSGNRYSVDVVFDPTD